MSIALSIKSLFLAQLIKEAGEIDSEKKLAKMLCYVEKERGVKTGFEFKDHAHGNYTFEIKEEKDNLVNAGLIAFREEISKGFFGESIKRHIFVAAEKLKNMELPLNEKQKRAVHSIYREYRGYSPTAIEEYDHAVYRRGHARTDTEKRKITMQKTQQLIAKHKGDEKAALEDWLSE